VLKKGLIVGAAAIVAIVLAIGGASEPVEAPEANVAACVPSETITGPGPADWRRASITAGPVAVTRGPLRKMVEAKSGQLYAKMGLLVAGHQYVVLSVPAALRERVFLYYGRILDNHRRRTTSFFGARGYAEIEFRPCRDRPRTVWPGGIRVIGHTPVNLLVTIEGHSTSVPLSLGKPVVYRRR
jgi:hypothetical protein